MSPNPAKVRVFRYSRLLSILLITVLLLGSQPVQPTQAATTYTVDILTDENDGVCSPGGCSLRDAINVAWGGDTIEFSVTGTMDLTLGYILIDKDLTISGPGAGSLSIRGDDNNYVFMIDHNVTISGLTITHAPSNYGGGIYNWGGTLTLNGVTITGNEEEAGGGIYNLGSGTITIENSIISGNTADVGSGGGIYNGNGTLTLNNCIVSGNDAAVDGGGIHNSGGSVTVENGSIIGGDGTGNTAINGLGGGIYNAEGTITVDGSTVSYNDAINGCGIYNWQEGTLIVQNGSFISENGNCIHGGGIFTSGTTTVDGSTVNGNSAGYAGGYGGGIFNQDSGTAGTLDIQNGSTIGGTGEGNDANHGGGIYNLTGIVTVDNSIVSANTAVNEGGGIYNDDTLYVQNDSTIGGTGAGNTSGTDGGGIYNHDVGATATVFLTVGCFQRGKPGWIGCG